MELNELEQARDESELEQESHEGDMITSPQIDYSALNNSKGLNGSGIDDGELLEPESEIIDGGEVDIGPNDTSILDDRHEENHSEHEEEFDVSLEDEYSNIDEEDAEYLNHAEFAILQGDVSMPKEESVDTNIAAINAGDQRNDVKDNGKINLEGFVLNKPSDIQKSDLVVIELVSDDEIENIEADTTETNVQCGQQKHNNEDVFSVSQDDQSEELSEFGDDEDGENEDDTVQPVHSQIISIVQDSSLSDVGIPPEDNNDDQLVELTRSQYEETEGPSVHMDAPIRYQPSDIQARLKTPIYIVICGDKYLLAPFNMVDSGLESIISLFSWDEVADCTILEFFLFLRHNGGLIDAYSFNFNDELKLRFSEIRIRVTEDTIQARDTKLADLLYLFQSLKTNSSTSDGTPLELTIHLSTQKRFITQLTELKSLSSEGLGFDSIKHFFDEETGSEPEQESPKKKRKIIS